MQNLAAIRGRDINKHIFLRETALKFDERFNLLKPVFLEKTTTGERRRSRENKQIFACAVRNLRCTAGHHEVA